MVLSPLHKLALHVGLRSTTQADVREAVADYLRNYPRDAATLARALDTARDAVGEMAR